MTEDAPVTIDQIVEQISLRRQDAAATLELLHAYQEQIEKESAQLENPQAVRDYLSFFVDFIAGASDTCLRIVNTLANGASRDDVAALRHIASQSALEQRRCLLFRDKCINKPLPNERLRPLLNEISVTTRDQLTAFRDLAAAAARLETLLPAEPPPPEPERSFDRRALFTRFLRPGK